MAGNDLEQMYHIGPGKARISRLSLAPCPLALIDLVSDNAAVDGKAGTGDPPGGW